MSGTLPRASFLLFIVSPITFVASLFISLALLFSARGRIRWSERLGFWNLPKGEYLWFHGASAGEVRGLVKIISEIKKNTQHKKILLTCSSPTGFTIKTECDEMRLLPLECPLWFYNALKDVSISYFIIAETELWPVLFAVLSKKHIPYSIVNGRISDRTFPRYKRGKWLFKPILSAAHHIITCDSISFERFIMLGASKEKVECLGNAKYDLEVVLSEEEKMQLHNLFCDCNTPLVIIASVRPGEEEILFPALKVAYEVCPTLRSIIAPRHSEKFDYFCEKLHYYDFTYQKRSLLTDQSQSRTLLLDTYGELSKLYSIASGVFIGGSLVPVGGHNPLEPAQFGVPVAMGPFYNNVREVVDAMKSSESIVMIENQSDATDFFIRCAQAESHVVEVGKRGAIVWNSNRGAGERIIRKVFMGNNDLSLMLERSFSKRS